MNDWVSELKQDVLAEQAQIRKISKEAMKQIKAGLKDAKKGRLVKAREDFSKYVE